MRVSINAAGVEGVGESGNPAMSQDGRYVAFESIVTSLISGDTNNIRDVFRKDLQTGLVIRASAKNDGTEITTGESAAASISANGDAIGFFSLGTDLVTGDTNGIRDTFIRFLTTATTVRTSVGTGGVQGNGISLGFLSADANKTLLVSAASNLVTGDSNAVDDVFFRNLQTGETLRVSVGTGN